jgi:hypothetical protein
MQQRGSAACAYAGVHNAATCTALPSCNLSHVQLLRLESGDRAQRGESGQQRPPLHNATAATATPFHGSPTDRKPPIVRIGSSTTGRHAVNCCIADAVARETATLRSPTSSVRIVHSWVAGPLCRRRIWTVKEVMEKENPVRDTLFSK